MDALSTAAHALQASEVSTSELHRADLQPRIMIHDLTPPIPLRGY